MQGWTSCVGFLNTFLTPVKKLSEIEQPCNPNTQQAEERKCQAVSSGLAWAM